MAEFFKKSKITEYEVQGEMVKFKGIPLKTIFKIRNLADGNKALAKLLAYFFVDRSKDAEVISTAEGTTNIKSIDPQIASMRMRDLEDAIKGLQAILTSPESQELVSEIIYYSATDCWDGKDLKAATDLIMEQDAEVFMELLIGSMKASSGVIKTLGKLFPQIPSNVANVVEEKLKDLG